MDGFSRAINLNTSWPIASSDNLELTIAGQVHWAETYLHAAELLNQEPRDILSGKVFSGPLMQLVGLANELTLKVILKGAGVDAKQLKKFSHNTYNAYMAARQSFDEVEFIKLVLSNTAHLTVPDEVIERLREAGEERPSEYWRFYPNHLRILDGVYDRPYRNRYATPGPIVLPEPDILLIGAKILLAAMKEKVE